MKEIKLRDTDYVLYDEANDHVVTFTDGHIVVYGDYEEASEDCYGNESIVKTTDLPKHQQEKLLKQILEL